MLEAHRGLKVSLLVLAVASIGVVSGPLHPTVADPACVVTELLVNPCRPWLGANAGAYPGIPSDRQSQITAHETRIGRQVDVAHVYHVPGTRPLSDVDRYYATRPNTIALINWKPSTTWSEAGGSNATVNAEIDAAADDIKSLGSTKIMLTLFHEPEDDVSGGAEGCTVYKGTAGTPAEYRDMWRNVRQRFQDKGVTNVVFMMNYMGAAEWDCMVDDLWPGDDLVDWVLWDPYSETTSWHDTVGRFYNYLTVNSDATHGYLSKPWGLGEWSVWRRATQAFTYQYYDDARASIAANEFPRLRLYTVFDNAVATPRTERIAYGADDVFDQVEVDHYKALANDPVFGGSWTMEPVPDTQAPTAPTLLTAADNTAQRVVLQWEAATDDVGVVTYRVFRNGAAVGEQTAGTTFEDTTVHPDSTYTYRVDAVDAAGNVGPPSGDLELGTPSVDADAPTAPSALTATETAPQRVALQWDAATDNVGVASYTILRDGAAVGQPTTATTFADTTVQPNTPYTYRVQANDAAGNVGPPSPELALVTPVPPDDQAPSAPGPLTATENAPQRVALAWDAATDNVGVASYTVLRDGSSLATSVTGTTYTDTTVEPGTAYTYRVTAVDAAGNVGAPTDDLAVLTPPPPDEQAPSAPGALTATENAPQRVALAWDAATDNVGVSSYTVLRNGSSLATSVTGTTYVDDTVQPTTSYTYRVQAVDAAGNVGPATADLAVLTPAPPDTQAPSVPTLLRTTENTATRVTLAWQASTDNVGVSSYQVFRNGLALATGVVGTTYADPTVKPATSYTYRVQAVDAAGNLGAATTDLAVRTPADTQAPTVPTLLRTTENTATRVTLAWQAATDNVGVVSYRVQRNGVTLATAVVGTTYADTTVRPATSYTYRVQAVDAAGNVGAFTANLAVVTPALPDTQAPSVPTKLTGTAGARRATLKWTASTDNVKVQGYYVYRGTTRVATVTTTTSVITGLQSRTTYTFSVRAFDAAGNVSASSTSVSVRPT